MPPIVNWRENVPPIVNWREICLARLDSANYQLAARKIGVKYVPPIGNWREKRAANC